MSSMTHGPVPAPTVHYLAHRFADCSEAKGETTRRLAGARFLGACEVVALTHNFMTAQHVDMTIRDAYVRIGSRPNGMGTTKERLTWEAAIVEVVAQTEAVPVP
jgi:hypothetical protein